MNSQILPTHFPLNTQFSDQSLSYLTKCQFDPIYLNTFENGDHTFVPRARLCPDTYFVP